MSGKYDDIIHLPRPVSKTRPRMSMVDRGAQFSAFAALPGFDAEIKRRTEEEKRYDEDLQQAGAGQDPGDY